MSRIHLFEFEDMNWFPAFLRNYITDFLQFLSNKTNMFQKGIPIIEKGLDKTGTSLIVDLASGGGGGMLRINEELSKTNRIFKILLTDYYPNLAAFEYTKKKSSNFYSIDTPVDARNVPENLKGLRTQFLSFHHFNPTDAQQILQNAVNAKSGIAIFEAQERSAASIVSMLFSPITVFIMTPFIRPFRLGRIVFTYLIPIVPLVVLWDGLVSSLRTYSVAEMKALVAKLDNADGFEWEIERVKSGPAYILYLLGYPKPVN
ncbi:hypothetical protein [Flavobacterium humi]|uniref:Class I SAM-dependent methyltransferase n=1 Tax=Flavobacterium humi TaxID=2562683 RepID=A0A4Z0L309_9FLAO|nr:hypothetical protein [Flavobacterium humi]TGD56714.1 hypothetical protein E4635_14830 [Flavobacterium humi]